MSNTIKGSIRRDIIISDARLEKAFKDTIIHVEPCVLDFLKQILALPENRSLCKAALTKLCKLSDKLDEELWDHREDSLGYGYTFGEDLTALAYNGIGMTDHEKMRIKLLEAAYTAITQDCSLDDFKESAQFYLKQLKR